MAAPLGRGTSAGVESRLESVSSTVSPGWTWSVGPRKPRGGDPEPGPAAYVCVLATSTPPMSTVPFFATSVAFRRPPRLRTTGGSRNGWWGVNGWGPSTRTVRGGGVCAAPPPATTSAAPAAAPTAAATPARLRAATSPRFTTSLLLSSPPYPSTQALSITGGTLISRVAPSSVKAMGARVAGGLEIRVVGVDRNASLGKEGWTLIGDLGPFRDDDSGRFEPADLLAGERVHDSAQARARDRPRTHGARLAARVHRGTRRGVDVELTGCPSGQLELGMGRDVPIRHGGVAVLREHVALGPHEQRSERQTTRLERRGGQLDGPAQVVLIGIGHGSRRRSRCVLGPRPSAWSS